MLGHKWEPGEGTVVDVRYSGQHGTNQRRAEPHFLMDVRPDSGGEPYRVEVDELALFFTFKEPAIGQVVRLECDPGRKQARFIRSDPAINTKGDAQTAKTAYEADVNAGPAPSTISPGTTPARVARVRALAKQGLLTTAQLEQLTKDDHVTDADWEPIREKFGD